MRTNTNVKETKEEKFRRLASKRTDMIVDDLRKLGNCSNRSNYSFSDEQVEQIFDVITEATESARSRFLPKEGPKPFRFKED